MATIKDRLNALGTKQASGQIATFDTNTIAPLDECKIHFLPWQEGEGDPSPENVRPIHGWNEFNVYHTGKNLFNWNVPFKNPDNIENNASVKRIFTPYTYCIGATGTNYFNPNRISEYEISNGKISWTQTSGGYGIGFPIPAKENTQYILSCSGNKYVYAAYYAEDGTYLGYFTISSSGKFTTPANTTIIVIVCSKSSAPYEDTQMSNIQVELGSTITSYEPYKGQSIPVNLLHPGKNFFTVDPYLQAINGITLIQRQDGGFEFSGTATGGGQFRKPIYLEAGTYVLSNYGSIASTAGTWYIRLLDKDATQLYSLSSASLTQTNFTLSASDDYICQIAFSNSFNPTSVIIYPQLQLGSTATTFQPYIYPPKSSKNLLNPFTNPIWYHSNYVIHSDGSVTIKGSDGRGWQNNQIIPLPLKKGTYTMSWLNLSGGVLHIYTSDDGYTTDHQSSKGITTFTLNNDGAIKFKFSPTTGAYPYPVKLIYMLQEGQVAHPVQPYYLQEPVYGGYIDLVQGKVVVDWIKTKIRDLSWNQWSNAGLMYSQQIDRKPGSAIYINNASIDGTGNPQQKNAGVLGYYETNVNYPKTLYIQTNISKEQENYSTARLNYIYETFADSYIIYQLNTPIQYPLTPQYIKALFGVNNIYSDTNDITQIMYKQYYDTDILETRRKIALNEPHIESASGIVTAFNSNMAGILKQNEIQFSFIQAGSETPNPNNIRPIYGRIGLDINQAIGMWDQEWEYGILNSNGEPQSTSDKRFRSKNFIPCQPLSYYNFIFPYSGTRTHFFFYNENKERVSDVWIQKGKFSTRTSSSYYFKFFVDSSYKSLYGKTQYNHDIAFYDDYKTNIYMFPINGKNLFHTEIEQGSIGSDGSLGTSSIRIRSKPIPIKAGIYTISYLGDDLEVCFALFQNEEPSSFMSVENSLAWQAGSRTITVPEDGFIRLNWRKNDNSDILPSDISNVQIEQGNQVTAYESCIDDIYGGKIDLATGKLTITYVKIIIDGIKEWSVNKYTNYNRFVYQKGNFLHFPKNNAQAIFNYCQSNSGAAPWNAFIGSTGNLLVYTPTTIDSTTAWHNYLLENPLQVCYELENPIVNYIESYNLKNLKGFNNMWSSTNENLNIKYWTH